MISGFWLFVVVYFAICGCALCNYLGWRKGWRERGRLAEDFEGRIRPAERRLGWARANAGLPAEDEPEYARVLN